MLIFLDADPQIPMMIVPDLSRKRVVAILRIDEATRANIENGTSRLTGLALDRVWQFAGGQLRRE